MATTAEESEWSEVEDEMVTEDRFLKAVLINFSVPSLKWVFPL